MKKARQKEGLSKRVLKLLKSELEKGDQTPSDIANLVNSLSEEEASKLALALKNAIAKQIKYADKVQDTVHELLKELSEDILLEEQEKCDTVEHDMLIHATVTYSLWNQVNMMLSAFLGSSDADVQLRENMQTIEDKLLHIIDAVTSKKAIMDIVEEAESK